MRAKVNLTRPEIRAIFKRHRGAIKDAALRADVSHPRIIGWLENPRENSANIKAACEAKARELLKQESSTEAA